MAYSYDYFKEDVKRYIENNFDYDIEILDVGAGSGTYQKLLPNYKNIDAIEVYEPYIDYFDLRKRYRLVYNENITSFKYSYYDLIIFGDIIEHLDVNDAKNVLEYAYNHCKEMIVAIPYQYKQDVVDDNIYEIHKQDDLTNEIFLERYPYMKLLYNNEYYGYYIKE